MTVLKAPNSWLNNINVLVVGAGGNGAEVLDALAQFDMALRALGHPNGISVVVMDGGEVREPNIVRQRFWPCDIGQNKAISLVNRYNMMMGLDWEALPFDLGQDTPPGQQVHFQRGKLIISAVDKPSVRSYISRRIPDGVFWLDLGNNARNGQAVLGVQNSKQHPTVTDLYPQIADMVDDNTKSCSTAEAIASQDCLINRTVSTAGMNILWELFRTGETNKNGIIIDLASGRQAPIKFPVTEEQTQ